jgi:titin
MTVFLGKTNIYLDTQHPQGKAGFEKVQEAEEAFLAKAQRKPDGSEPDWEKPYFTVPLAPEFRLGEAEPLHLECNVEPKADPNLKIEWYFNGKALEHGK